MAGLCLNPYLPCHWALEAIWRRSGGSADTSADPVSTTLVRSRARILLRVEECPKLEVLTWLPLLVARVPAREPSRPPDTLGVELQEEKIVMPQLPSTREMLKTLVARITSELEEDDTRWWTAQVKSWAADALEYEGPKSRSGQVKGWDPEYLVDAAVSRNVAGADSNDPFGYTELLLALESEWNPSGYERAYDFCKLADVRARRKIFIGAVRRSQWGDVEKIIVEAMLQFWNRHSFVEQGEEVGVILFGYGFDPEPLCAWVLTQGADNPIEVCRVG